MSTHVADGLALDEDAVAVVAAAAAAANTLAGKSKSFASVWLGCLAYSVFHQWRK
jgi:hypothetical protein